MKNMAWFLHTSLILGICLVHLSLAQNSQIRVSKTGNGFRTIQQAINAAGPNSEIFITSGTYSEKIVVPSTKSGLTFRGQDRGNTIIDHNDFNGKARPDGKGTYTTMTSYTMLIQAPNVRLINLTVKNSAGPNAGQALALYADADKFAAYNSNFIGNQDTICNGAQTNKIYRQYYENCYIEGTTDYIFGSATAIFQSCTMKSFKNAHITAASTPQNARFGYIFRDCTITASATDNKGKPVNKVRLGRPWGGYAKTVFINTSMGSFIAAEGWTNWGKNVKNIFFAEYQSKNVQITGRVSWSRQLSGNDVGPYMNNDNVFTLGNSNDVWRPVKP